MYYFLGMYRLSLAKMSHTNRQTNIYVVKRGISSDGRSPKVDFDKFFPLWSSVKTPNLESKVHLKASMRSKLFFFLSPYKNPREPIHKSWKKIEAK